MLSPKLASRFSSYTLFLEGWFLIGQRTLKSVRYCTEDAQYTYSDKQSDQHDGEH